MNDEDYIADLIWRLMLLIAAVPPAKHRRRRDRTTQARLRRLRDRKAA